MNAAGINFCADFLDPGPDPARHEGAVRYMADHIEHMRRVGGVDMIALGSDFDGIERTPEITDCSRMRLLEAELRRRRFTEDETEKIFGGNALRLLRAFLPG